jgi:hypothetical protein
MIVHVVVWILIRVTIATAWILNTFDRWAR